MRIQKLLSSTLFTGIFVAVSVFSPAMGQETSPNPQGKWALTKVDRVATNGNSYCTLSHKYDNDVVLSLGRNLAEEYSLAIDFQKPVFEKDKSLKISLQPGPGQVRSYDLMPASEKALVIRLGWDSAFFKTLDQTQSMKVTIADKSYGFSLPDITKGQTDLKGCMEELKVAAGGNAASSMAGKTATKDVLLADAGAKNMSDFNAEKSTLNINKSDKPKEKVVEEKVAEKPAPKPEIVAVEKKKPEQVKPVAAKKMEPLTPAPIVAQIDPQLVAQNAKLESDLKQALSQSKALEGQLSAVQKTMENSKTLEAKIAALEAQVSAKDNELKTAAEAAAKAKAAQDTVMTLQAEISAKDMALKTATDAAAKGQSSVQETLIQKTSEVEAAKVENASLVAKLAELEKEKAAAQTLQQKVTELETKMKSQEAEFLAKPVVDTVPFEQKIADLEAKLKSQEAVIADKTVSASGAKTAQDTLAQKTAEFEAVKIENKALNDKVAALQKTLTEKETAVAHAPVTPLPGSDLEVKKANEKVASLEAKVKELEIKNTQLQDTVRQSQTRIAETAVNTETNSVRKIVDLQAKLEAAQKDNITLAKQLDAVKLQQEDKRLNVIAGDWDLEKATKRFNEAEREVQRLGLQLEKERTSCNMEKAQIEEMLFDPAVTEQKQIEKLTQLENELEAVKSGKVLPSQSSNKLSMVSREPLTPTDNAYGFEKSSVEIASIETQDLANITPAAGKVSPAVADISSKKPSHQDAVAPMTMDIPSLLEQAGVSLSGFKKTSMGMSGADNFSWKDENMKGFASLRPLKGDSFDGLVSKYLDHEKGGCQGDFASIPTPSSGSAKKISFYEVACVTDSKSTSASILFYETDGQFVAISNQTDAANMDMAMDNRDRIANAVRGM